MLSPATPASLSTLTTSSSATFSWRPPQRTIAYTRELSLSLRFPSVPQRTNVIRAGSLELAHGFPLRGQRATPDRQGYQTVRVSRTTRTISPGVLPPHPRCGWGAWPSGHERLTRAQGSPVRRRGLAPQLAPQLVAPAERRWLVAPAERGCGPPWWRRDPGWPWCPPWPPSRPEAAGPPGPWRRAEPARGPSRPPAPGAPPPRRALALAGPA